MSLAKLFVTSLPNVPWNGFVFGLFVPLTLMHIGGLLGMPALGAVFAVSFCILFFCCEFVRTRQPNAFALITLFMIATQFAAKALAARMPEHATALSSVGIVDEASLAAIFFLSMWTKRPLVLLFLDRNVTEAIPPKIRRSSYYLTGWRLVTAIWGLLYAAQAMILAYLLSNEVPHAKAIEFIFGWPLVLVLLVVSVMLPRWYWTKNMTAIEQEAAGRSA